MPVLEEDSFVLPESDVIMEYLEERYPEPALLPADPGRAGARPAAPSTASTPTSVTRTTPSGAVRTGRRNGSRTASRSWSAVLAAWPLDYGLAEIAYAPWLIRLRDLLGFDLAPYPALEERLGELTERPAIAAELDVVAALPR